MYSFLPSPDEPTLNFGKTQVYGLSESSETSRDCDVTWQLMSVMATRYDNETDNMAGSSENLYANTAPVRTATQ